MSSTEKLPKGLLISSKCPRRQGWSPSWAAPCRLPSPLKAEAQGHKFHCECFPGKSHGYFALNWPAFFQSGSEQVFSVLWTPLAFPSVLLVQGWLAQGDVHELKPQFLHRES